ncbi:MAG: phosphotransferase family protein [Sphingomonas sp.]
MAQKATMQGGRRSIDPDKAIRSEASDMVNLSEAVLDWVAGTLGGRITRLDRAVARREAWLVDARRPDGTTIEAFLRIERDRHPDDPSSLAKEVAVLAALARTDVPVPGVYGSSEALGVALFERLRGRPDLPDAPVEQQRAVMRDFIAVVARLHSLDPEVLGLEQLARPATPAECALGEVDRLVRRHADFLARGYDPLLRYGIAWLRRFVPESVARVSLVQGDTGPTNFMFEGDRVASVFDWEWAHFGDPIEDLGNIATREFWNPSGGMAGLLDHYAAATGFAADRDRVRYYCVQQQIRGMIGIHRATVQASPHEPITWYLAYRYIGDRATCEAIADAMHVRLDAPDLPEEHDAADPLAEAAVHALNADIAPGTSGDLAAARIRDVEIMIRCMDRVARYGRQVDDAERAEAEALLGIALPDVAAAAAALNRAIDAGGLDDAALLRFLYRRAARREWLYLPCTRLYPDRAWSPL